ncbi:deoxynucleotide monophosphate kinase family protein [Hymenobacter glacieicola]|uniref:Uncharacterized protein n=1 Tax=Hymenobacter glacieicola TaxID=1562124 RepID=A0ABQ1X5M2_9BACT|nr:hypothetical protein [Hymenobacter glacieicola]GGG61118.1 hypothetical protein GCM10011378_41410 [Hymenobacter glacieicola]
MHNLKLLGISGKRGSGKGAVVSILEYHCGYHHPDVIVLNFADPLKSVCATLENPLEGEADAEPYYTQEGKAAPSGLLGLTRGQLLQDVGQALRDKHPSIWVDVTTKTVAALLPKLEEDEVIVVADIRYPNEAEAIKNLGGILLRVEGDPLGQRGDGTRDDNHPSETALDEYAGFDQILLNNGTLDSLKHGVREVLGVLPHCKGGQRIASARTGNSRWRRDFRPLSELLAETKKTY